MKGLAADYPELRGVVLAAGVGQSSATLAGIRAARGEWIATLDADLQNDPADLVALWEALPGHDAALGWRVDRQDVWSRRWISRWANRVRNGMFGQSIRDTGCSVRIFPREVALRLPAFRGVHRFFGPLLLREGCRLVQVPVRHRPRPHGRSHYNLWNRSLQVVVDLLGVAWLMRRPLRYRVVRTWDAAAMAGEAGSKPRHRVEDLSPVSYPAFWLTIGFLGQGLFTARFLVQWMAFRRRSATRWFPWRSGGSACWVAQRILFLRDLPARSGDRRRPVDGAVHLREEPDADRPGPSAGGGGWRVNGVAERLVGGGCGETRDRL